MLDLKYVTVVDKRKMNGTEKNSQKRSWAKVDMKSSSVVNELNHSLPILENQDQKCHISFQNSGMLQMSQDYQQISKGLV